MQIYICIYSHIYRNKGAHQAGRQFSWPHLFELQLNGFDEYLGDLLRRLATCRPAAHTIRHRTYSTAAKRTPRRLPSPT